VVTRSAPSGFTLVELLVATAVTLVALGLAVALLHPPSVAFHALPEATDAQQRIRVAVQTLVSAIGAAGAGPSLGWGAGATPTWPGVLPCDWRAGPLGSVAGGCARQDAITVVAMDMAAPQAMVMESLPGPGAAIRVAALSACSLADAACRMHPGARALITDGSGAWDVLSLTGVSADGTLLEHANDSLSRQYADGAIVGEVETTAFSLRLDPASQVMQLRRVTAGSSDLPVLDHVTALSFEYFGDPAEPQVTDDGDADWRRTTYGPLPPPSDIDDPQDGWAPGENCVFSRLDGQPHSRLVSLPAEASGLARLPLSAFTDGPWCPDGASPNRFDGDLLRIRLVRVTLRVQAQSASVRGTDVNWFSHPGVAREAARLVPDLEVHVDVAIRNTRR
jgi:prepilin-type N-terminal cleavage/methylation domain-containing protein